MLIAELQIRSLIAGLLLEGVKDDIIAANPDVNRDDIELLARTYQKGLSWLNSRFGPRRSAEETHPINDAIATLKLFAEKDTAIGAKYAAGGQFTAAVDTKFPKPRKWESPNEIMTMSVDEMETILKLVEIKKQRTKAASVADIEKDRVGKVGPWNLWMPTTRENSVTIAQYDPVTLEPKTQWCTARTAGSNLFYNYTAKGIILFYIIKDEPRRNEDWLSVGFINGKMDLEGDDGGASVDRVNKGLTPERLKSILGTYYDEIVEKMVQKNSDLGGQHPARQKIVDAGRSVESLRDLTRGLSKSEASQLNQRVIAQAPDIDPEVMKILATDPDPRVRLDVAMSSKTPPDVLEALAKARAKSVRLAVARNGKTPPPALHKLASDRNEQVKRSVAHNPNTPIETLIALAGDSSGHVKVAVALNPNTPFEALMALAGDSESNVRYEVAGIKSIDRMKPEILAKLAGDTDYFTRLRVAENPITSPETLRNLKGDSHSSIKTALIINPNTPIDVIQALAEDPNESVSEHAKIELNKRQGALNESRLRRLIRQLL